MLHMILFVLKILGWILLVVLGLFVLMFLLVLFIPLRYQIEARCKGKLSTLEAGVQFHILFHLVSGNLRYEEQRLTWNVRAAWIKLGNGGETVEIEDTDADGSHCSDEDLQESPVDESVPDSTEQTREEADEVLILDEADAEPLDTVIQEIKETEDEEIHSIEEKPKDLPDKDSDSVAGAKEAGEKSHEKINNEPEGSKSSEKESLLDKIASVFEKIKYTFSHICDKIKVLWKKVEEIKAFLENNTHQTAFWKLIAELKKMLFRMRPKQVEGKLEFGFEDPSLTGRVLAGLSMLYPYWEVRFYPNFERKVLDGNVSVKGAARLWPAAALAWNLIWMREVRRTVMDIKKIVFK